MYVCVCEYIYISICIHTYVYVCVYIYIYIYIYRPYILKGRKQCSNARRKEWRYIEEAQHKTDSCNGFYFLGFT